MSIPQEVIDLAQKRVEARKNKDYLLSDQLRDEIAKKGFLVKDTVTGFDLVEKPEFEVFENLNSIKYKQKNKCEVTVLLLVEGWLEDTKECLEALLKYLNENTSLLIIDFGNKENVGNYLNEVAKSKDRVEVIHVSQSLQEAGWANSINKLIELNENPYSVIMDLSSIISEDIVTKLLEKFEEKVAAVGWKGALVNLEDQWRSVEDKGDGEVDILLSYFFVIKTEIAKKIPANTKAKFYRNADLEWSLSLRKEGYKLIAFANDLKIEQKRHHGYHDSDIEYRDKESKKTYNRILQNFRGKTEILSPRR
jgi:GT2 family glycosyltransferase